ncbi:SixA phosphatase family protein [Ancylobacter mangrovi]|uniref:Histidine phosphatase family protein n=1 Tax=Ancylobacter mangrovi TaxID=2972472 RepID=A0A9X2PHF1_9HYPH|nr:histidine phosphatase family protein [Ancylobacter mangrovi]MCS0496140.1 histidine phosphatase family protein [Ancylobacter mangrovi]MCS0504441.1 histidine phosphatase family protein [Ancylobacter mangrovi]
MLRLFLLRHAKSAWPDNVPDRDRPLGPRGLRAAPAMGAYMEKEKLVPTRVLVSPARRTIETWEQVSAGWAGAPPAIYEEAIYESSADALLALVQAQGTVSPLMLVGHNPGMEEFAARLLSREQRARALTKFPTGALAVIDLPVDDWSQARTGSGMLERFVTPRAIGVVKDGKD